mmetsp:Transcript_15957/g.48714  ORF Transcript_15957/g.48714 Transcript_15957/m.48714 type:complete len:767 (-) Transcript_15957:539-2839(-)
MQRQTSSLRRATLQGSLALSTHVHALLYLHAIYRRMFWTTGVLPPHPRPSSTGDAGIHPSRFVSLVHGRTPRFSSTFDTYLIRSRELLGGGGRGAQRTVSSYTTLTYAHGPCPLRRVGSFHVLVLQMRSAGGIYSIIHPMHIHSQPRTHEGQITKRGPATGGVGRAVAVGRSGFRFLAGESVIHETRNGDLVEEAGADLHLPLVNLRQEFCDGAAVRQLLLVVLAVHEPDAVVLVQVLHDDLVLIESDHHEELEDPVDEPVDGSFVLLVRDGEVAVEFVVQPRALLAKGQGASDDGLRRAGEVYPDDGRVRQVELVLHANNVGAADDLAPGARPGVVGEHDLATLQEAAVRVRVVVGTGVVGADGQRLLRVPEEVHVADVQHIQHVLHGGVDATVDVHGALDRAEARRGELRVVQRLEHRLGGVELPEGLDGGPREDLDPPTGLAHRVAHGLGRVAGDAPDAVDGLLLGLMLVAAHDVGRAHQRAVVLILEAVVRAGHAAALGHPALGEARTAVDADVAKRAEAPRLVAPHHDGDAVDLDELGLHLGHVSRVRHGEPHGHDAVHLLEPVLHGALPRAQDLGAHPRRLLCAASRGRRGRRGRRNGRLFHSHLRGGGRRDGPVRRGAHAHRALAAAAPLRGAGILGLRFALHGDHGLDVLGVLDAEEQARGQHMARRAVQLLEVGVDRSEVLLHLILHLGLLRSHLAPLKTVARAQPRRRNPLARLDRSIYRRVYVHHLVHLGGAERPAGAARRRSDAELGEFCGPET